MAEETVNKEKQQEEEPAKATARISELEQMVADRDSEITALKRAEGELREQLSTVNKSLAEAVSSYKEKLIQMSPGITEELIDGVTIEAIDKSMDKALNLIGQVRKSVEKELARTRVPAGAPGRQAIDLSALSPREKIQYAIGGKK